MKLQSLSTYNLKEFKHLTGIYLIKINTRDYIGSSIDLQRRLGEYKWMTKMSTEKSKRLLNPILSNAALKYGEENVKFKILEYCKKEDLLEREKFWIEKKKPFCNFKLDPTTQQNCKTTSKEVYQFSLSGEFIKKYPSTSEAERQLNIVEISAVARGVGKSRGGYLWSYNDKCIVYENNSKLAKIKSVYLIENNEKIFFKSIADCARFVIDKYGNLYPNFDSLCAVICSRKNLKVKTTKYINLDFINIDGNVIS